MVLFLAILIELTEDKLRQLYENCQEQNKRLHATFVDPT